MSYRHLCRWRRTILLPCPFLMRLVVFCWGFHWISIGGRCDNRARLIITNHTGILDAFVFSTLGRKSLLIEKSLTKVPIIGLFMKVDHLVAVDREHNHRTGTIITQMKSRVSNKGEMHQHYFNIAMSTLDFPPIVCCPEGTNSNAQCFCMIY